MVEPNTNPAANDAEVAKMNAAIEKLTTDAPENIEELKVAVPAEETKATFA